VHLAVVGEAPGTTEILEGRPFVGPSGRLMLRELGRIGLQRHQVHWSNAVLCSVRKKDLAVARKCCAERLRQELAAAAPPVVMPVGALGARSSLLATKSTPILKWRGSISKVNYGASTQAGSSSGTAKLPSNTREAWVLPTIHPAFVLRAPQWERVLRIDIQRAQRVAAEGFTPPEEITGRRFIVARTLQQLEEALHLMRGSEDSGFDVETVGLGPMLTNLVCFGLSDIHTTVIVPWASRRDGSSPWWPQPAKIAGLVSEYWKSRRVITHNGPSFDHIIAHRYGLQIEEWDDTLIAAHATAPELPKNLAHVVTMGLDVAPWKTQEDRTADLPRLFVYNGRDTLYTILRWAQMRTEVGA
jgi:uracil-DNA glycosylase family 4